MDIEKEPDPLLRYGLKAEDLDHQTLDLNQVDSEE
jgi:hypothetical protein